MRNQTNKDFCDYCGEYNVMDSEYCLTCGADLRPEEKEQNKASDKKSTQPGKTGLGFCTVILIILLLIILISKN